MTGELGYLALAQPDAVSLQAHIKCDLAVGSLEQDDLIEGLLLEMVFGDQCHGRKPENRQVVFAMPEHGEPGKALNTRPTAARSVWGIEHR